MNRLIHIKILSIVIAAHLLFFLLIVQGIRKKEPEKTTPLCVRTIIENPLPKKKELVVAAALPQNTVIPKKKKPIIPSPPSRQKKRVATNKPPTNQLPKQAVIQKKGPVPKRPLPKGVAKAKKKDSPNNRPKSHQKGRPVDSRLLRQLQESIAKIEEKSHKENGTMQLFTPKSIAKLHIEGEENLDEKEYAQKLIACLQNALFLPEAGEVKIELTLDALGKYKALRIMESRNRSNQQFLKSALMNLSYPPFSGTLKLEKEHTFVLTFCNH